MSARRRSPRSAASTALAVGAALVLGLVACGDDGPTAPGNAPADHTVVKDGRRHAPGLETPLQRCTGCHGADLRGGANGEPSCFNCHGQEWP